MQVLICPIENSWGHGWPKAFIKNSFVCSTFDSGNVLCEKVGLPPFATWNEHSFFFSLHNCHLAQVIYTNVSNYCTYIISLLLTLYM